MVCVWLLSSTVCALVWDACRTCRWRSLPAAGPASRIQGFCSRDVQGRFVALCSLCLVEVGRASCCSGLLLTCWQCLGRKAGTRVANMLCLCCKSVAFMLHPRLTVLSLSKILRPVCWQCLGAAAMPRYRAGSQLRLLDIISLLAACD
jgi:hypothetical protein